MANLLNEEEFTQCFTDAIKDFNLEPSCKEALVVDLHYGADEPVLTLSLKEIFSRYQQNPDGLEDLLEPYLKDLGWTVQSPRFPSKDLYENSLPSLRNFYLDPPSESELGETESLKGPIVYEDVLKTPAEYVVMQFNLFKDGSYIPLCKGDTLPCIPNAGLLSQLSLHNLALATESAGLTATPLQFESLKARSWLIGLADERYRSSVAALSCIPPVMASLEETLHGNNGLIAIMPASDQLIVSIDTGDEAIVELGVLAQQLRQRIPKGLSGHIWIFRGGNLSAVQALELQEHGNDQDFSTSLE